ncbi:hypothetical protein ABEB36_002928 [Hypothenemus hampei]|uniref:Protein quiver n=1 Tax=Hypothenemus hampei TaxID=57062 RepID=A0ABD1F7F9_HYPHA
MIESFNMTLPVSSELEPVGDSVGVCIKFTLSDSSDKATGRTCTLDKIGTQDVCTYVQNSMTIPSGYKFTCNTCKSDLCNSSSMLSLSFTTVFLAFVFKFLTHFL